MGQEYNVLAPFYNRIGMSAFAEAVTPRLLDYAQRNDWLGRRILDLGCGTGAGLVWLGKRTYSTYGVDSSPEMLTIARNAVKEASVSAQFYEQDIRKLEVRDQVDLVLAINVMNELETLRDFEAVFKGAANATTSGRFLIFDLQTLEGLVANVRSSDRILFDKEDFTVITRDRYDYERQALSRRYIIFDQEGVIWHRTETETTLRGFPIQAVGMMLQRSGFQIHAILNQNLGVYDPSASGVERVYFVAKRV